MPILDRKEFIKIVSERAYQEILNSIKTHPEHQLEDLLHNTIYFENLRLEAAGKNPKNKEEREFWKQIKKNALRGDHEDKKRVLRKTISWYTHEIQGHFKPAVYNFSTRVLPLGLSVFFSHPSKFFENLLEPTIENLVEVSGEVEQLRDFKNRGTIILAPMHSSNMDSPIIGWQIYEMGLPPVNYGAGLNLFTNPVLSFFMNSLGAYKVDRKKKGDLYKFVLKTYSTVLLERGGHSLFFPGGTRSRSGGVENKLKLGLLGTGLDAYII